MNKNDLKLLQEYSQLWKQRKEIDKKIEDLKPQLLETFEKYVKETDKKSFNYLGIIWRYVEETFVPEHIVKETTRKASVSLRNE